jgi:3-keto-disaccharide hydrolase
MVQLRSIPEARRRARTTLINNAALVLCLLAVSISAPDLNAQSAVAPFLGRWDLTLTTPSKELPSWIEVSEARGQPRIVMVGVSDHATPLPTVSVKDGQIEFLSPKDVEGFAEDMSFKGKLVRGRLVGTVTSSGGTVWHWTGSRAPSLKRAHAPEWGKPIRLFDGKDFKGWRFRDPSHASNWKVEDGTLVTQGHGSEIITDSKFEDFKLHIEFNCGPKSNSGVYLRGRYEVQIETDSAADPPDQQTGAVYGFLTPSPAQPRRPGVWQTYDITLIGRTVTLVQNGRTIVDHKQIPGITGGALDSHEGLPGPIYLQGSEEGRIAFRNIVITPAKD